MLLGISLPAPKIENVNNSKSDIAMPPVNHDNLRMIYSPYDKNKRDCIFFGFGKG
jgi:hypothetical protein